MHGFISGLSILFHWFVCWFLCQYHIVLITECLFNTGTWEVKQKDDGIPEESEGEWIRKCDMIANSTEKPREFGVTNSNWQLTGFCRTEPLEEKQQESEARKRALVGRSWNPLEAQNKSGISTRKINCFLSAPKITDAVSRIRTCAGRPHWISSPTP